MDSKKTWNLVLIGKTGSGKSSVGNSILGWGVDLMQKKPFETSSKASSVTRKTWYHRKSVNGRNLVVIDTPGFGDTEDAVTDTTTEITKCIGIASQGIHAFLFVSPVGRFKNEDVNTVEYFRSVFGPDISKHLIVVFSGLDNLEYDGTTIEDDVKGLKKSGTTSKLADLLKSCNNRYVAFNNRTEDKRILLKQTTDLLKVVDDMLRYTDGNPYIEKHLRKAEEIAQKEIRKKQDEAIKEEIARREKMRQEEQAKMQQEMEALHKMKLELKKKRKIESRGERKDQKIESGSC